MTTGLKLAKICKQARGVPTSVTIPNAPAFRGYSTSPTKLDTGLQTVSDSLGIHPFSYGDFKSNLGYGAGGGALLGGLGGLAFGEGETIKDKIKKALIGALIGGGAGALGGTALTLGGQGHYLQKEPSAIMNKSWGKNTPMNEEQYKTMFEPMLAKGYDPTGIASRRPGEDFYRATPTAKGVQQLLLTQNPELVKFLLETNSDKLPTDNAGKLDELLNAIPLGNTYEVNPSAGTKTLNTAPSKGLMAGGAAGAGVGIGTYLLPPHLGGTVRNKSLKGLAAITLGLGTLGGLSGAAAAGLANR